MRSRVRRAARWAGAVVAILVAATTAPVAAAEPPPGVAFDGTATVSVRALADLGAGPPEPLPGVLVTVVAYVNDFPEAPPLQPPVMATTGPDGRATFGGLARPAQPGTAVRLAVDAFRQTELPGPDDCTTTEVWAGSAGDLAWPPPEPIVVEAVRTARAACPELPVLDGRLLDARGEPLAVQGAWATIGVPGEAVETLSLAVGADGAFTVELPALGTFAEPATLAVRAVGSARRTVPYGDGCLRTYAEEVSWSRPVALAEGATLEAVELTAVEIVVGERCGTRASGPPAPPAPSPVVATPSRSAAPAPSPSPVAAPVAPVAPLAALAPSGSLQGRVEASVRPTPRPSASPSARVAGRTFVPDASDAARTAAGGPVRPPEPRPAPEVTPDATTAPAAGLVAPLGAIVLLAATLAMVIRRARRVT